MRVILPSAGEYLRMTWFSVSAISTPPSRSMDTNLGPFMVADYALRIDNPQSVARTLEHIHIASFIDGDRARIDQRRIFGVRAVGRNAAFAITGDRGDNTVGQINFANAAVVQVSDVDVSAGGIE